MNPATDNQPPSPARLSFLPFGLLFLVYAPVLGGLLSDWYHDDNYSHGFLVPVVSLYLLWKSRPALALIPRVSGKGGLLLVLTGLILLLLGTGASEYFTVRFSFVVTLFGLTYYLFGRAVIREIWFALFFLLFMIPIPYVVYYSITFPMQTLATDVTVSLLDAIGLGILRQGNIIHLSEYSLEVAEACSGIRSLVSLLALGALYAYATQKRFTSQIILFLCTVPIAVVANVVRVFITALFVSTVSAEVTVEPWHTIMGSSVFVFSFICLFIAGQLLSRVVR